MNIVSLILTLVVYGLVFWLLWWLINYIGIPQPFLKVAQVILAVGAVILCIYMLLSLTGADTGGRIPMIRLK